MKSGGSNLRVNRTGAMLAPEMFAELVEATQATRPSAPGDAEKMARVRISYASGAEPTGTIPPPAPGKEGTAAGKLAAKAPAGTMVFVDKLGERLAFERSGVRLYEALLSKFDAHGSWKGGPMRADLEEIRNDEHEHYLMLAKCAEELGADPTAVTPSANLHAVVSKGLPAALADPRTTLRDGLEAILVAELVDNDCWENLSDLARTLGRTDLVATFDEALAEEREHLRRVRTWLGAALAEATPRGEADPFAERARARERAMLGGFEEADEGDLTFVDVAEARGEKPAAARAESNGRRTSSARGGRKTAGGRTATPKRAGKSRPAAAKPKASARGGAKRSAGKRKTR